MKNNTENELMNGYLSEMEHAHCLDAKYWKKTAGVVVMLTNGGYFCVEKSKIETRFCFGYNTDYSGHELSDAEKRRAAFAKSEKAFKNANLRDLDQLIEIVERGKNETGSRSPYLSRVSYCGEDRPLNVWQVNFEYRWKMAEKGMVVLDGEDKEIVLGALKKERANFEKRLDMYLKKYGTSKLHTWTYWRDE